MASAPETPGPSRVLVSTNSSASAPPTASITSNTTRLYQSIGAQFLSTAIRLSPSAWKPLRPPKYTSGAWNQISAM